MSHDRNKLTHGEAEIYAGLAELSSRGENAVLATVIDTRRSAPRHAGSKMIVYRDGTVCGSVGGGSAEAQVIREAASVLEDGQCRTVELDLTGGVGICGGEMRVFLEPVLRSSPFYVIGAGHVGRAVAVLGQTLPLRFTVIDDRPEVLGPVADLPGVGTLLVAPGALAEQLEVQDQAGVLIASRNHEVDAAYLQAVFDAETDQGREFGFLGVLASRTKAAKLRSNLAGDERRNARLERLQLPVGLDLGAETPGEIALSVLAEALAVLRGGDLLTDSKDRPLGVRLHRHRGGDS